ncbi:MAG TPA: TatD family hydrolase [Candidatus Paceibacterota bacterium]
MKYIDIHCHLNLPDYESDLDDVIERAKVSDIGIIIVGIDIETSRKAVEIAEKYDNIWATVAIHPDNAKDDFDFSILEELAKNKKVVGIGETGLDLFHSKSDDIEKQKEVFIEHIRLANSVGKPLMLHIRNGKDNTSVYSMAIDILKKYAKVRSNFHFFAGNRDDIDKIIEIDATVSFTGVLTFTRDYDDIVKCVPIDRIMSETDAPYVSPIPYRGKRNEPKFVEEVVKAISNIKGQSIGEVSSQIIDNARKLFCI